MLRDPIIAGIRTGVAAAVAFVVTFLASKGVDLDIETQLALSTGVMGLSAALYNFAAILLARRWPFLGYLLGVPSAPTYSA